MSVWFSWCGRAELRHGDYREVLLEQADVCLTDVPYGARAVAGARSSRTGADARAVTYDAWTPEDADAFADWCCTFVNWRVVAFCCHTAWTWLEQAFQVRGWHVAPINVWLKEGAPPTLTKLDPDPDVEFLLVARPRREQPGPRKRNRDGWYRGPIHRGSKAIVVGQKPVWLADRLLADYTLRGDRVIDPFAGGATFPLRALAKGRRCIASERSLSTWERAARRLEAELPGASCSTR